MEEVVKPAEPVKNSKQKEDVKNCRRSAHGRLIGEANPGARLTDHEVELLREMHEEYPIGHPQHVGHRRLAQMFGVSRSAVSSYCHYRKRVGHL